MGSLKFGGDMQRVRAGFVGIGLWILAVSTGWAITITEPKPHTVFHPGDKVMVKADLTPEEDPRLGVIIFTGKLTKDDRPIAFKAPYEWEFTIDKHFLGEGKITVAAKLPSGDITEAKVPVTVVLPPTTTVTGIGADFTGQRMTSAQIGRKPNGELVSLGGFSERKLSVGADYSDDVARDMAGNPDVTYKSLDEKVAIVFPPGKFKLADGRVRTGYATVQATGPGKTDIIVQYGNFTDRVTIQVRECPYVEGKMEDGCPR